MPLWTPGRSVAARRGTRGYYYYNGRRYSGTNRSRISLRRPYKDADHDGIPNYRDRDIDGDGVVNWHDRRPRDEDRDRKYRRYRDPDHDGRPNFRDRDIDGDGVRNSRDRHPRNDHRR